ncbi:PilN domain-containing protein [Massilia sp. MS-15]|uniref:PilN domain-containing protein n=1 Tax=Massilia sp. MS-15 TaxID=2878200 RepID=UPI001CD3E753|nr:PilN domain-containing protein [Massilia sp. MS-15]MCA1245832.1 PilN domain-containing protein [Massilia sp. MS-15]
MSQQINLFNPVFRSQKKIFALATMAQAMGVLVLGVAALAFYGQLQLAQLEREAALGAGRLARKQASLGAVANEFAPRKKSAELAAELAQAETQLAALQRISGVLERGELGDTSGYSEYLRALARQSLDGLWLTGLGIATGGREISIRGRALDPALVPTYIGRLTSEAALRGKAFAGMQISEAAPLPRPGADGRDAAVPAPYVEFSLQARAGEGKP